MNEETFKNDFLSLPIYREKNRIVEALNENQIIIVESYTGSGKTTQLPLILLEHGFLSEKSIIGMTEPRRIATTSVSRFIRAQIQSHPEFLGAYKKHKDENLVGHKIRFEDSTSSETKLKLMTDGILLQELKLDPQLSMYSTLIIDEAHERNLNIDFILGLLRELCIKRDDLKIIISSATINTAAFSQFFFDCPVIRIDAPVFPIKTLFLPPKKTEPSPRDKYRRQRTARRSSLKRNSSFDIDIDVLIQHIVRIVQDSVKNKDGDILIFLAGEKQIKVCIEQLYNTAIVSKLFILPLYGRLDNVSQDLVFEPAANGKTKIIVATNIAETSITIDSIKVVIDSGRVKLNSFQHSKHISTLEECAISRASALQRRGRAGRTSPGTCYHLYRKEEFDELDTFSKEEIYRTDLSEVILRMADQDINDFESFNFVSPPKRHSIHAAVSMLQDLDALDSKNYITSTGSLMSNFPLLPIHARMLVEGINKYPQSLDYTLKVISFLSTPNPFLLPMGEESQARIAHHSLSVDNNDFLTYINIFDSFVQSPYASKEGFCEKSYLDMQIMQEIFNVHEQLSQSVSDKGIYIGTEYNKEHIICSIARGLIFNFCILDTENAYRSRTGERIFVHPGSTLFDAKPLPPVMFAGELVQTSKKFARSISSCKLEWVKNISLSLYYELERNLRTRGTQKRRGAGRDAGRRETAGRETDRRSTDRRSTDRRSTDRRATDPALFHVEPRYPKQTYSTSQKRKLSAHSFKNTIALGDKTFTLETKQDKQILPLSWKDALAISKTTQKKTLDKYGRIRCKLFLSTEFVFHPEKLSNLSLLCMLYKSKKVRTKKLPEPSSSTENGSTRSIRKNNKRLHKLLDACMCISTKKNTGENTAKNTYPQSLYYCSLETEKNGSVYIEQHTHFLTSLYGSIRSLELILKNQNEKKLRAKAKKLFNELNKTYQLLES